MNREEQLAKVILDNQIEDTFAPGTRIVIEVCRYCQTAYNLDGSIDCPVTCISHLAEKVFRK